MPSWIWLVFVVLLALFAWPSLEPAVRKRLSRWRRHRHRNTSNGRPIRS